MRILPLFLILNLNLLPSAALAAITVTEAPYNARGDNGITDNTPAFQAACNALYPAGGEIDVPPGNYWLKSGTVFCFGPIRIKGEGRASILTDSTRASGLGGIVIQSCLSDSFTPQCPEARRVIDRTATGALSAGTYSLRLSDVSNLKAGDTVYFWLGVFAIDTSQPYAQGFDTIKSIAGNVVTFDSPLTTESIPDPSTYRSCANGCVHHVWKTPAPAAGVEVSGLTFVRNANVNPGIEALSINYAQDFAVRDIYALNTNVRGAGFHYFNNGTVENFHCQNIQSETGTPTLGVCLHAYSFSGLAMRGIYSNNDASYLFSSEGRNTNVSIDGCRADDNDTLTTAAIAFNGLTMDSSVSNCEFDNPNLDAAIVGDSFGDEPFLKNIRIVGAAELPLQNAQGGITWQGLSALPLRHWSSTFPMADGASLNLPAGFIKDVRIYVSTIAGLSAFHLAAFGSSNDFKGCLIAGQTVDLSDAINRRTCTGVFPVSVLGTGLMPDDGGKSRWHKSVVINGSGFPPGAHGAIWVDYFPISGVDPDTTN